MNGLPKDKNGCRVAYWVVDMRQQELLPGYFGDNADRAGSLLPLR